MGNKITTEGPYSLKDVDKTISSIVNYVKVCMREQNCGLFEVKEYERCMYRNSYAEVLSMSEEYIIMLNNLRDAQKCLITYK